MCVSFTVLTFEKSLFIFFCILLDFISSHFKIIPQFYSYVKTRLFSLQERQVPRPHIFIFALPLAASVSVYRNIYLLFKR